MTVYQHINPPRTKQAHDPIHGYLSVLCSTYTTTHVKAHLSREFCKERTFHSSSNTTTSSTLAPPLRTQSSNYLPFSSSPLSDPHGAAAACSGVWAFFIVSA